MHAKAGLKSRFALDRCSVLTINDQSGMALQDLAASALGLPCPRNVTTAQQEDQHQDNIRIHVLPDSHLSLEIREQLTRSSCLAVHVICCMGCRGPHCGSCRSQVLLPPFDNISALLVPSSLVLLTEPDLIGFQAGLDQLHNQVLHCNGSDRWSSANCPATTMRTSVCGHTGKSATEISTFLQGQRQVDRNSHTSLRQFCASSLQESSPATWTCFALLKPLSQAVTCTQHPLLQA